MDNVFIIEATETAIGKPGISRDAVFDLESLLPLMHQGPLKEDLKRIYPYGTCHVLGFQECNGDNLAAWDMMAAGDLILGYRNHSIVSATFLLAKTNDPAMAVNLWGDDSAEPFGLICFTDRPYLGEVPILPQMERYLDREYGAFSKLNAGKAGNILTDYGSLETFVHLCLRYDFPFSFRHS